MKDFKGRKCSSRHFRRGNQFVPVLIPLDWKNDWQELNKQCRKNGAVDIPEDKYWKWREEQETSHAGLGIVRQMQTYLHTLKNRLKKLL